MSYIDKQPMKASTSHEKAASVPSITAFSDRRASTAAQLKQQKMMQFGSHSAASVTQLEVISRGKLDGLESNVTWDTKTLGGDTVGVKMEATTLGPEHQQGTPPKSGEQNNLMKKLPTEPSLPAEDKYIRGHLLNDNVGGLGIAKNLYPITANANKQHESIIESKVKQWVNADKQWVYYKVEVSGEDTDLSKSYKKNYVNADLKCEASILDPNNNLAKSNTISATIKSRLGKTPTNDSSKAKDSGARITIGTQASTFVPLLSTSKAARISTLNENLFIVLKQLVDLGQMYSVKELVNRMGKIPGVGKVLNDFMIQTLTPILTQDSGEFSNVLSSKDQSNLTRLNNLSEIIIEAIGDLIEDDYDDETRDIIMGDL